MACSFISGWGHKVHPNNPPAVAWSSESYWNLPPIFLAMLCWRSANGVASRDVAPDRLQTVLHLLAASDCEGGGDEAGGGAERRRRSSSIRCCSFTSQIFLLLFSTLIWFLPVNIILFLYSYKIQLLVKSFFLKKRKCLYKDTDSIFFFKCLNVTEYK